MIGRLLAPAYWSIALFTFGWSAAAPDKVCHAYDGDNRWVEVSCGPVNRSFDGLVAGAVWPLYWTWTAVEAAR